MQKTRLKISLISLSVLATLAFAEIYLRLHRYDELTNAKSESFLLIDSPLYEFNERVGYRYLPNQKITARWINEFNSEQRRSHFQTDAKGHVTNIPRGRKLAAYKIAILGDSLATCIHNDFPWADHLENLLNADTQLKRKVGKQFEVTSFARDGIGLGQFPWIVEHEVLPETPDLLMTHFITADIYRYPIWRKTVRLPGATEDYQTVISCTSLPAEIGNSDCTFAGILIRDFKLDNSPATLLKIKKEIAAVLASKIRWWHPYPEILHAALPGVAEKLFGKSPFQLNNSNIPDRAESIETSANALRKIREFYPKSKFFLTPVYWEMVHQAVPKLAGEVATQVPELGIIPMLEYMPPVKDRSDVNPWTNHPYDMHFSNEGARVYAKAVHAYLRDFFLKEGKTSGYISQR